MLLVRKSSEAYRIDDLKGATICYSDLESTTGYLLPRAWIRRAGMDPDTDFQAHVSGNHTSVLTDLLAGKKPNRESVLEPTGPRTSAVPPAGKPRPRPDAGLEPQPQA